MATDVAIFTRAGVARIMRFAFKLARSRPRKLLTVVTKSNAQRHGMVMWDDIAAEVAKEYPDVTWDKMLVDAMTVRMTLKPASLDTIVATNLHADILSDLASALAGSIGVAPTANLNPERTFPSMFEPIHGSAFDITGKGIANPVGTFWSAVMMLEHLGEPKAAARLMRAIERVTANKGVAYARSRRRGAHQGRHRRGDRGAARGQRLTPGRRAGDSGRDARTSTCLQAREHTGQHLRKVLRDQAGAERVGAFAMQPDCGTGRLERRHALRQQSRDEARKHVAGAGGGQRAAARSR